jgi:hypothetical protein
MKASVYLETTVISYFCSRPSQDIVINARQQITQQWWDLRIGDFDLFVSDIGAAAVNGLDYKLTWNFAHINNAENRTRIDQNVKALGYICPIICTPEELIRG